MNVTYESAMPQALPRWQFRCPTLNLPYRKVFDKEYTLTVHP
jgi:hypothetical protein